MPLKFRDVIRIVEVDGWFQVAQKGSHRQYKHPRKPGRATIPGKPGEDVHPVLEKSILEASADRKVLMEYTVII